jgi:alpha-L-rhamnosidase
MKKVIRMVVAGFLCVATVFAITKQLGTDKLEPIELRCEYLVNPLGIDVVQPRFSWRLEGSGQRSEVRAQKQGAYRVLVASSLEKLEQNQGDLWDTGKVESDRSTHLVYNGEALISHMQCFWKVMVWDNDGKLSDWSKAAHWSMGLLNATDWKADWIGFDKDPATEIEANAKSQDKSPEIVITKALYGVPGNPKQQVDVTTKLQAQVSAGKMGVKASNGLAGKDPAFGTKKMLVIDFTLDGKAKNIKVAENSEVNIVTQEIFGGKAKTYFPSPHLRKEFMLNGKIERAMLYATSQGFAEMHLNGKRVGDEYFMPGWTDYRKRIYYRSYDVTSMLKSGENTIGAILGDGWFRGNISNLGKNQYGKLIRLMSQLHVDYADGRSEIISSDKSWKASFGPILESDMQAGETYDAREEIPGWSRFGFDDSNWASVNVGSALQAKPLIQAYPGVPVRNTQELPTLKLSEPKPGKFVFDLGQNFSGWIRLQVEGEAGEKVVMRFGEMLNADGTLYTENLRTARATDTYICKGGGQEIWEPHFTFHGFQYVEISGLSAKPTPKMVTGIAVHSDAPLTSSFECSNPMLNQLHSNILWGQRSNYLDVPTDCPQRDERMGWTGDTQVFIRSACFNQDVAAFFTKWNVDLMDTQNEAGTFGQQAPVYHGHGSPAWADAGVICPWTIYKVYGDARMVSQCYDAMARFIKYCRSKGLKGPGGGFGDWLAIGSNTPKDLISAAYFGYCTSLMVEIADALGKHEDAAKYSQLFNAIRANFQKSFVSEDGKIKGDSQTGYCLALYYDLLTDKQREQAAKHLVQRIKAKDTHLSVGFVGVSILLPTLTDIGRSDLAYRLIQNTTYPSWGYSIEQGATTIWERWNSYTKAKGFGPVGMNSFNHYAYGSCSEWMFRSMLGIDTDGVGFKKIKMKPEFDESITWAKGHYDSIHGRISSDWKLAAGIFEWAITIPPNTTATVYMPESAALLMESGSPLAQANGVKFLRIEQGRAVYELQSGHYNFKTK